MYFIHKYNVNKGNINVSYTIHPGPKLKIKNDLRRKLKIKLSKNRFILWSFITAVNL